MLNEFECDLDRSILFKCRKVFSFSCDDMPGLYLNLVVHNIITYPDGKPIKKKPRNVNLAQSLFIKEELQQLLKAHFIEPIEYPNSNMVHVNRYDGCIYIYKSFCDLNKACPKDDFPIPNIDILV